MQQLVHAYLQAKLTTFKSDRLFRRMAEENDNNYDVSLGHRRSVRFASIGLIVDPAAWCEVGCMS